MAKWTLMALLLFSAGGANAQSSTEPLEKPQRQLLSCSSFKPNADGTWTAVKPITLGAVTINAGDSLRPGTPTGGIDLAAKLNANCLRDPRLE